MVQRQEKELAGLFCALEKRGKTSIFSEIVVNKF
jgi:hypothetical protein